MPHLAFEILEPKYVQTYPILFLYQRILIHLALLSRRLIQRNPHPMHFPHPQGIVERVQASLSTYGPTWWISKISYTAPARMNPQGGFQKMN